MDTVLTVSEHTMSLRICTNHMFGFHPSNKYTHAHIISFPLFVLSLFFTIHASDFCLPAMYFTAVKRRLYPIFFHGNFFFETHWPRWWCCWFFCLHLHLHLHASVVNKTHKRNHKMRLDATLWKSVDLWMHELDFYCPQINYRIYYYFYYIWFPLAVYGVWEIVKLALLRYCCWWWWKLSLQSYLHFHWNVKCIVLFNVLFRLFICFAHLNATTLN